ncbi:MAG: hypothetical protein J6T59_06835 [Bacteroidales bacterium]|nr:hypothetical protein [Bacteroidales bacterium]
MEKRIGTITVFIYNRATASQINSIISQHAAIIVARQGLPFRESTLSVISIIVEGEADQINALSGKLGKLPDVEVKAVMAKNQN